MPASGTRSQRPVRELVVDLVERLLQQEEIEQPLGVVRLARPQPRIGRAPRDRRRGRPRPNARASRRARGELRHARPARSARRGRAPPWPHSRSSGSGRRRRARPAPCAAARRALRCGSPSKSMMTTSSFDDQHLAEMEVAVDADVQRVDVRAVRAGAPMHRASRRAASNARRQRSRLRAGPGRAARQLVERRVRTLQHVLGPVADVVRVDRLGREMPRSSSRLASAAASRPRRRPIWRMRMQMKWPARLCRRLRRRRAGAARRRSGRDRRRSTARRRPGSRRSRAPRRARCAFAVHQTRPSEQRRRVGEAATSVRKRPISISGLMPGAIRR